MSTIWQPPPWDETSWTSGGFAAPNGAAARRAARMRSIGFSLGQRHLDRVEDPPHAADVKDVEADIERRDPDLEAGRVEIEIDESARGPGVGEAHVKLVEAAVPASHEEVGRAGPEERCRGVGDDR